MHRIVGNVVGVPGGGAPIDETNLVHKSDIGFVAHKDSTGDVVSTEIEATVVKCPGALNTSIINNLRNTDPLCISSANSPIELMSDNIELDSNNVTIKGKKVAVVSDIDSSKFVQKTGDETIKGRKRFENTISADGGISLSGQELDFDGGQFKMVSNGAGIEIEVDGGELFVNGAIIADSVYVNGKDVATTEDIESAVGDIETALDKIIAIQNSLIGGDSE